MRAQAQAPEAFCTTGMNLISFPLVTTEPAEAEELTDVPWISINVGPPRIWALRLGNGSLNVGFDRLRAFPLQ